MIGDPLLALLLTHAGTGLGLITLHGIFIMLNSNLLRVWPYFIKTPNLIVYFNINLDE